MGARTRTGLIVLGVAMLLGARVAGARTEGYPHERPVRLSPATAGEFTIESLVSFDCRRARTGVEKMICSDRQTAYSDHDVDFAYRLRLFRAPAPQRAAIALEQREWLKRRDMCPDIQCLRDIYEDRAKALRDQNAARSRRLRASVLTVGACEVTRIQDLEGRLEAVEGERPDGMTIEYADGVSQVSYDRIPKVLRSKVGDRVKVCLAWTPHRCPPGDDRGRVYSSYNLRTHARWKLPDSEHACGGA
jgi:uncharacterized protein YecT (DUF1311 family)